jgi:peptidoglycan/xylan/chitin deacetylase (PgdA/CDA1 family)
MSSFRSRCKEAAVKAAAAGLSHARLVKIINWFVNRFQRKEGAPRFPFIVRRKSGNVQILFYHRVNDDGDPFFPGVPVEIFAGQMRYLAANFHVCSLEDAIERMKANDLPENAAVITFDDGYRDNYVNAFPVLRELSLPATIFIATEAIGSGKLLWHDRVFAGFRETRSAFLRNFNGCESLSLRSLGEKLAAQKKVLHFLWAHTDAERELWIGRLLERLEVPDRREESGVMLSWDDVIALHRGGISFGSHTVSHPILSKLPEQRIKREIADSKREIERHLNIKVDSFAYPVGRSQDFSALTKSLLKETGYRCALTTVFGTNSDGQDPFELRRMMPWHEDPYTFGLRLRYYKFTS